MEKDWRCIMHSNRISDCLFLESKKGILFSLWMEWIRGVVHAEVPPDILSCVPSETELVRCANEHWEVRSDSRVLEQY